MIQQQYWLTLFRCEGWDLPASLLVLLLRCRPLLSSADEVAVTDELSAAVSEALWADSTELEAAGAGVTVAAPVWCELCPGVKLSAADVSEYMEILLLGATVTTKWSNAIKMLPSEQSIIYQL